MLFLLLGGCVKTCNLPLAGSKINKTKETSDVEATESSHSSPFMVDTVFTSSEILSIRPSVFRSLRPSETF